MFGSIASGFGSILISMLGSAQLASLWRKALLAAAVALLAKYGVSDPAHLIEVIGAGVMGASSIAGSVKAHMPANQDLNAMLNDAVQTAVQAALASALPAVLQGAGASKAPAQPQAS